MLAWATAPLAMLALAGGARACELNGLFGLQFGEAVPQQLVLKQQEQAERSWLGIVTFSFRPATAERGFAPLEASATGHRRLLTSISGINRQNTVVAAKEHLSTLLADYTARHGCRFREDRAHLALYPGFSVDDSEAHVSTGSKSIAVAQRDGARVVLRLRSLRTIDIVKQDPPKD